MTIVLTQAYNAEKTLPAAIESVLQQTDQNFEYHIMDSASTDNTWEMILNAAKKDRRIIPVRKRVNHLESFIDYIEVLLADPELSDSTYLTILDADDTLHKNAIHCLKTLIKKHDADLAVGGYEFLWDGEYQARYIKEIALDKRGIVENFPLTDHFMRTNWAKLFPFWLLRKADLQKGKPLRWAGDTLLQVEIFRHANRVAFTEETVLIYTINPLGISKRYDPENIYAPGMMFRTFYEYLDAVRPISDENMKILHDRFFEGAGHVCYMLENCKLGSLYVARQAKAFMNMELTQSILHGGYIDDEAGKQLDARMTKLITRGGLA